MPITSCLTVAIATPSLVCGRLPTLVVPTGIWSSAPFANCTPPVRQACSFAARKGWAASCTYCVTNTVKVKRASASYGVRRISKLPVDWSKAFTLHTCLFKEPLCALRRSTLGSHSAWVQGRKILELDPQEIWETLGGWQRTLMISVPGSFYS